MRSWVFQANPKFYRVDEALAASSEHTWLVNQHKTRVTAGDEVFIWRCGPNAAIVGVATVITNPAVRCFPERERIFQVEPGMFAGSHTCVTLHTSAIVPIRRELLLRSPETASIAVFKGCSGTNFAIPEDVATFLRQSDAMKGV